MFTAKFKNNYLMFRRIGSVKRRIREGTKEYLRPVRGKAQSRMQSFEHRVANSEDTTNRSEHEACSFTGIIF